MEEFRQEPSNNGPGNGPAKPNWPGWKEHWHGHHHHFLLRVLVGILILILVFWLGVHVGRFQAMFGFGEHGYDDNYRGYPMMRQYQPMMYGGVMPDNTTPVAPVVPPASPAPAK